MRFEFSALKDFRNLGVARFDWGPRLNLILGPNGAGKTNLLESLGVLAGWGAFSGPARGTVSWGSACAFLKARASGEGGCEVEARVSSRLALRVDGKAATCTDLRMALPSLTFLPTDVSLIDGSPAVRRLFLDKLCALYHPLYARRLAEFRQVFRSRSALLRQGRPVQATALPFARLGGWVMEARRHVASQLRALMEEASPPFPLSFSMLPEQGGAGFLLAALEETAERERYALKPLVGPGRDDLELRVQGRPASEALSRGQKRRAVLALILTAGRLIERRLGRSPVLLFDDLAAELDAEGRRAAGEALEGTGWQVFVTGTEDPFADAGLERTVCVLGKRGIPA